MEGMHGLEDLTSLMKGTGTGHMPVRTLIGHTLTGTVVDQITPTEINIVYSCIIRDPIFGMMILVLKKNTMCASTVCQHK